jgi:GNAT superfamily N-acetyltransferase
LPGLSVRDFDPARDLATAGALLAARHRRDRQRLPMLAASYETASICASVIGGQLTGLRSAAVVAEVEGRLVGFLLGEEMLFAPTDFPSQFIPPHSISMGIDGHAVAEGEDTTGVYRAMYAVLAERWVRDGFFTHQANIVPGDAEAQEAWVSLGFGRHTTAAVRSTGPIDRTSTAAIEVHRAGAEDIGVVMKLSDDLSRHHNSSPIFWPYLRETDAATSEFNLAALANPDVPYFIAYDQGQPVAMQTFLQPGFTPPIVEQEGNIYLFDGVVSAEARSGGIGTALLAETMLWAREHGFKTCTLHYASGNPSGAPFWLGHGFVPVEYTMSRHIDERVAWARP